MMKKKGMVLLMTLFFIVAITLLIFENLKYSEDMIAYSSKEDELAQLQFTSQNIKEQIIDMIYKKRDNLESILPIEDFTLSIGDKIDIDIKKVDKYSDKINIYKQNLSDELSWFVKDRNITTNKQLKFVLKQYLEKYEDSLVEDEKENFSYFDTNSTKFISCSYEIGMPNSKSSGEFIFNTKTKEVVDFEFVSKR